MYIDGVYIGGNRGTISDLPDIERIEVLRGPQGTLFGRNATAGAVQFVTRDPTGEMAFRQDVTIGNQAQLRTRTTRQQLRQRHAQRKVDAESLAAAVHLVVAGAEFVRDLDFQRLRHAACDLFALRL